MQVKAELSNLIARPCAKTPDAVGRRLREDAAIEGYRIGRLSCRQVGEMIGLDYWQTEAFFRRTQCTDELLRCGLGG